MHLEKASRKQSKIKISLAGSSGSGKSFSALLLAHGLCNDYNRICVIDTENYSASLYSHLGDFHVINLAAPFHPQKFIDAISLCEKSNIDVVIIDGISPEWSGKGGCLDLHEKETAKMRVPNSFTAWAPITRLHQAFIDAIVNSQIHVVTTVRSKTEYVLTEKNGRQLPQKMGMAPITRDGFDFEVTIAFDLDQQHKAFCTKDRSQLFQDREPFIITPDTGKKILDWCNSGEPITVDFVSQRIGDVASIQELLALYKTYPQFKLVLQSEYEEKKRELLLQQPVKPEFLHHQSNSNGTT